MLDFFLSMLMLVFAVASIIAGIFTAYFGSGKSRMVGMILVLIGLIVFFVFLCGAGVLNFIPSLNFTDAVIPGIVAIIGAIIGALVALGIFLLAIMKA